jgi:hypothetical protein
VAGLSSRDVMMLYNRYLLILAALFTMSTCVLAIFGQDKLDAYFTTYVIEYLIVTLLFVHLNPKARRLLDGMGYALFGGFGIIVALKVIEILKGP